MTINKGTLTTTVPAISDCNVSTVAARNINAHVYSAVLKSGETDGIAANFAKPIADEETISTKADLDSGVGKFRVSLDNGKYHAEGNQGTYRICAFGNDIHDCGSRWDRL